MARATRSSNGTASRASRSRSSGETTTGANAGNGSAGHRSGTRRGRSASSVSVSIRSSESSGASQGGTTFADFSERFTADYLPGRNLKPSTVSDYGSIITGRLIPFFSDTDISRIDAVAIDGYISHATGKGLTPKTVRTHLALLRVMFKVARRWTLIHAKPVEDAEMPRVDIPEMSILSESEIAGLLRPIVASSRTPRETPTGGGSVVTSSSSHSEPRCVGVKSSGSAGVISSCGNAVCMCGKRSCAGSS